MNGFSAGRRKANSYQLNAEIERGTGRWVEWRDGPLSFDGVRGGPATAAGIK